MNKIISITLRELKDKPFDELVELYQNSEHGLIIKFRNFEKDYYKLKIKKKIAESKDYNEAFLIISEAFFHHYNLFWIQYKNNKSAASKIRMDDARVFFESCNIHISKINTHYLQPLTIKKANISIVWGILSVLIGVIATILSCWFSYDSNMNLNHLDESIKKQLNINVNIEKNLKYIDSLSRDNNKVLRNIVSEHDSSCIINQ
jgi:cysteinyl-tRNA synthetase